MAAKKFLSYVYRIFDAVETLYVGKGSGRRLAVQCKRYGAEGEVLERFATEDEAFAAERVWIARLKPSLNILAGGNGGRCRPRKPSKDERAFAAFERELNKVGSRRYVARYLLTKLDEANCIANGMSLESLRVVRSVANGERC